jgi:hypothetical protein
MLTPSKRKARVLLSFLCIAAGLPGTGHGDDAARASFLKGIDLVASEEYAEALSAFESSYWDTPNPNALFNIAMCEKALFLYPASIRSFEEYLSFDEAPEGKKEAARKAISEMRQKVGRLLVQGDPHGTIVSVDGEHRGRLPLTMPLLLEPGIRNITFSCDGYRPRVETLEVAPGVGYELTIHLKELTNATSGLEAEPASPAEGSSVTSGTEAGAPTTDHGRGFLIAGIAAAAAGLGGLGAGGYFTARGVETSRQQTSEGVASNRDAFDREVNGMIAGYLAGGITVAAGVALLMVYRKKKKHLSTAVIRPVAGGVAVHF